MLYWNTQKFHQLNYEHSLRLMIPSVTALIVSCQVVLGTFFLSILGIKHTRHPVTAAAAPLLANAGPAECWAGQCWPGRRRQPPGAVSRCP